MPRFLPIALSAALVAALALTPAPAAAKNLQAATICGPDACSQVPEDDLSIHLVEGGGASLAPERPEPWYRVRVTVGGGGGHESWWLVVLPRGGYTGFPDGPNGDYEWGSISASTAALYRRLAGDLRPFSAAKLRLARETPAVEPVVAEEPAVESEPGGGGVAIAGAIAGAVLLVGAAVSLYRRRSAST